MESPGNQSETPGMLSQSVRRAEFGRLEDKIAQQLRSLQQQQREEDKQDHGESRGEDMAVVVQTVLGSHFGGFRCNTHVRTDSSGDWDVHWGCGILTHGHMVRYGYLSNSVAPIIFPVCLVAAPLKMVFPKNGSLFSRVTEQLGVSYGLICFTLESPWL